MDSRNEQLKVVSDEVWNLSDSELVTFRLENGYQPVLGEGDHNAEVMFVGEAPGEQEAKTGRPFVGRSGKILDRLLASVGWPRESVYITSILKDRPPKNRDPLPEEIKLYTPFLERQIRAIQPKGLATLGRFSMSCILEMFKIEEAGRPIGEMHGKILKAEAVYGPVFILPLYHPAVAIYNQASYKDLEADFKKLASLVKKNED